MPLNEHERLVRILLVLIGGEQMPLTRISSISSISYYSIYHDMQTLINAGLVGSTGKLYTNETSNLATNYVITTKGRKFLDLMIEAKQLLNPVE